MPKELLSRDLVHTVDAIELPPVGSAVEGRSARRDSYPIAVTRSFEDTVEWLLQMVGDAKVALITDTNVAELYGPVVIGALEKAGVETEVAAVPAGERHKTLRQVFELLDWLSGTQICRRDVVVLLGGGVPIDMGGFAASAYMRGVPYLCLPTTLIGQVDAGLLIGGVERFWQDVVVGVILVAAVWFDQWRRQGGPGPVSTDIAVTPASTPRRRRAERRSGTRRAAGRTGPRPQAAPPRSPRTPEREPPKAGGEQCERAGGETTDRDPVGGGGGPRQLLRDPIGLESDRHERGRHAAMQAAAAAAPARPARP